MKICVYAASGALLHEDYFSAAEELGRCIAKAGHSLVYGGGKTGLMGACARGVLSCGGQVTGISPHFFNEPGILLEECTRLIFTDTMRERKALMEEQADAFIMLPGGIGTYEEFFEILTLKQLGRHSKPISVINTRGCYEPMLAMLRHSAAEGFMNEKCLELFRVCAEPSQAVEHCAVIEGISGNLYRLNDA